MFSFIFMTKFNAFCFWHFQVIQTHFWLKRHEIIAQIKGWIKELESYESEGRSGRSCSLSNAALKVRIQKL